MRILVSHPDSMGDLILREPLYAELLRAGHDLLIVANLAMMPVARCLFPAVKQLEIPADPYGRPPASDDPEMTRLRERIEKFAPECLLFTAYVRTWFDEWLHASFAEVYSVGFGGSRYPGSVRLAQECTGLKLWELSCPVHVPVEMHEHEKSRRLCESVLGRSVDWREPGITASLESLEAARCLLERHGITENAFWVACVGDSAGNRLRNWAHERWSEVMRYAADRHGWRFVLIGTEEEQVASRAIRDAMGRAADHVVVIDDSEVTFEILTGITARSQGYLGRDTGPMHLASALSKPVLAVFGGGTWPRFTPLTNQGEAFTLEVPCSGCGHICHLSQYHCIKAVPLEPVIEAIDRLAAGLTCEMSLHNLRPASALTEQMGREAGIIGRDREWLLVRRQEQLDDLTGMLQDRDQRIKAQKGSLKKLSKDLQLAENQSTQISSSRWYRMGRKLGFVKPKKNNSK